MQYEKYDSLLVSSDALEYKFTSLGPKGEISIVVQFAKTETSDIYNLAFGNLLPDGSIDDHVKNNNHDRNKILATVAAAVYEFSSRYPGKLIYFTGSTPERTRLYRMALSINLITLNLDFEIYGVISKSTAFWVERFAPGTEYQGFLVIRKKN